jgi:hypothetical protein
MSQSENQTPVTEESTPSILLCKMINGLPALSVEEKMRAKEDGVLIGQFLAFASLRNISMVQHAIGEKPKELSIDELRILRLDFIKKLNGVE